VALTAGQRDECDENACGGEKTVRTEIV